MQNCDTYVPFLPSPSLAVSLLLLIHTGREREENGNSILPNYSLTMPTPKKKKHKRYFCNTAKTFHFPLKIFRAQCIQT